MIAISKSVTNDTRYIVRSASRRQAVPHLQLTVTNTRGPYRLHGAVEKTWIEIIVLRETSTRDLTDRSYLHSPLSIKKAAAVSNSHV